ncbi:MAG TPA: BON domain-containing protein [Ferrovibrio sp.]|uniref:BON domain-containing protein n=1 Tax=Ferrovibrio sp. TaxID=1917215 RepID=UPI002B4B42B9|nr:BON domain-containing protein [Ferrovibrio sp.]HLT77957.1 BON domain-containing protein [Ferrovibrio sp.]
MLPFRSKALRFPFALLALLALAPALSGCLGVAVGAGAAAGVAAAEERGAKNAANDKGIQLAINDALFRTDLALFHKLGTIVYEGRVLLTGVLQTEEQKDQALKLVWSASDRIREVIDEIVIAPPGTILDFSNDAWITGQLRFKLASDREIVDINYSIETVNGTVYLIGLAQNEAELMRVTDHARTIRGVRRVVSHVWLKTDPRRQPI